MRAPASSAVLFVLAVFVPLGVALPRPAAAKPASRLVPASDAKLGASLLAPAGWRVRFGRPGTATVDGKDAKIEVEVTALDPAKPPADLVHSRIGLPPKAAGGWTCGRIVRPTWAQAMCAKAVGQQVVAVSYEARSYGREGDPRLLIQIGESAKGFAPGRPDPRDDRARPVKLVPQTLGGNLTALAPEDWTGAMRDDGTLELRPPSRDESVAIARPASALDEPGAVSLSAGADEVTRPPGWLCFRKGGSASCLRVRPDHGVDLTVSARMADAPAATWIVGALPAMGASVDLAALRAAGR
jgi:hypothetical protein